MNDIDRQIKKEERSLETQRRFDMLERKIQLLESQIKTMGESSGADTLRRLYFNEKLNEVLTSAPTYIPKTFHEQFAFYSSGGERRFYVYIDGSWVYEIVDTASSVSPSMSPSRSPSLSSSVSPSVSPT